MVNLGIISRIFPTLFSKLISIFIFLLNTFSMGVKTRARLTQERLHYAQWLSLPASVPFGRRCFRLWLSFTFVFYIIFCVLFLSFFC